jgi:hypothetical protein
MGRSTKTVSTGQRFYDGDNMRSGKRCTALLIAVIKVQKAGIKNRSSVAAIFLVQLSAFSIA